MEFLAIINQHLSPLRPLPRRCQRTSGEHVGNGHSNITAPTLVRPIDDVINDPSTFEANIDPDRSESGKTYRTLPIFSGIMIPLSIMLSIPGLTGLWYIRMENNETIEIRPNPVLLDVVLGFSIACAVFASAFLVIRFAERSVKLMTLASIAFLTLHDLINIPTVTVFGIVHRFDDDFTYGQSFWFTVCSTIVSTVTNITLIADYLITKDFAHSGSGLTHKQRSLVIIVIVLLTYISIGSLVQSKILDITFINALYFSVVTIETIGYGDIYPPTPIAKVVTCVYIAGGVLNIALAVVIARDVILESAVATFRQRILARQHERRLRARWRAAVRWRLRERNLPTWVNRHHRHVEGGHGEHWYSRLPWLLHRLFRSTSHEGKDPAWRFQSGPRQKRLNLEALTNADLHAAALEAGAPLIKLVPEELRNNRSLLSGIPLSRRPTIEHGQSIPTSISLTHFRLGGMLALLGNVGLAVTYGANANVETTEDKAGDGATTPEIIAVVNDGEANGNEKRPIPDHPTRSHGVPLTVSATMQEDDRSMEAILAEDVKYLFYTRLCFALFLFFAFWVAGSLIFMLTEDWTFGSAAYFCFITFSTQGYGDLAPKTPAGRSLFVFWALLGVATMTILISVILEAYTERYKIIIKTEVYEATSSLHSRWPQVTEHQAFPSGFMGQGPSLSVVFPSSNYTRAGPVHALSSSTAKSTTKTVKIEEGGRLGSRDNLNEKRVVSFEDHLKSLITIARAQRDADANDAPRLENLISRLEGALRDLDVVATGTASAENKRYRRLSH